MCFYNAVERTGVRAGVVQHHLKYGDPVIITANPSRTPNDHKLHMLTLKRTFDGFDWGTRPGEVIALEP
ncbi:MAG: hypothetical protein DMF87_04565 [Acidobacteria bacterium]|nr:MAG: hypothetical protein DMF88_18565 [Acidobacteriota bacterium]PYR81641.1 MAG: hypothetical protein DMF87_04565 [Acidobacteriota bacterium]